MEASAAIASESAVHPRAPAGSRSGTARVASSSVSPPPVSMRSPRVSSRSPAPTATHTRPSEGRGTGARRSASRPAHRMATAPTSTPPSTPAARRPPRLGAVRCEGRELPARPREPDRAEGPERAGEGRQRGRHPEPLSPRRALIGRGHDEQREQRRRPPEGERAEREAPIPGDERQGERRAGVTASRGQATWAPQRREVRPTEERAQILGVIEVELGRPPSEDLLHGGPGAGASAKRKVQKG